MLVGKGLLTPIQKSFLRLFSNLEDKDQFYLAGGTALAEYYLGHRLSYDLDLFTGVDGLVLPVSYQLEKKGKDSQLDITVVRRFSTYVELLVKDATEALKIDLALDSPFRFAPPEPSREGVLVNNYVDLITDKLLAFFGRTELRDAIDLYFILKDHPLDELMDLAKQKDTGFDLYWFAVALNHCADFPDELDHWPVKMLLPFDPVVMKSDYHDLAIQILDRIHRGYYGDNNKA